MSCVVVGDEWEMNECSVDGVHNQIRKHCGAMGWTRPSSVPFFSDDCTDSESMFRWLNDLWDLLEFTRDSWTRTHYSTTLNKFHCCFPFLLMMFRNNYNISAYACAYGWIPVFNGLPFHSWFNKRYQQKKCDILSSNRVKDLEHSLYGWKYGQKNRKTFKDVYYL